MRLGLSTYSYTWAIGVPGHAPASPMTLHELIRAAHELEVQVVQIADNSPLHLLAPGELRELHEDATHCGVRLEVGTRGLTPENVRAYIAIARKLDSEILRVVVDAPGFEPGLAQVIDLLKGLIPVLKGNGVRLAIENHDRFLSGEFVRMIVETDPEWVGICLDSVNSLGAGEGIAEVVRTLAPHTINLHLKEFTIKRVSHKMGFVVEGLPAGQGMLNIPALVETIKGFGKCNSAILELWTPPSGTLAETIKKESEWVADSIRYLKARQLFH